MAKLNRTQKVEQGMRKVLKSLEKAQAEALALLLEMRADSLDTKNWEYNSDLSHFYAQISDIISVDNEEAGLKPFVCSLQARSTRNRLIATNERRIAKLPKAQRDALIGRMLIKAYR
jgi:hypothetical protein